MKIKWYGQSCFVIDTVNNYRILTDPYDKSLGYRLPPETPDIVTVSHSHFDHKATESVKGDFKILDFTKEVKMGGVRIKGIKTWHDKVRGKRRGPNRVFKITADNIDFVHLGDIGHKLSREQVRLIRPCDICAVPVGGHFTVGADGAYKIVKQLKPNLVFPMHYSTPKNKLELEGPDDFIKKFIEVRKGKIWEGNRSDISEGMVLYRLLAHGELA
ncbi:MAG: MBL fold metallo-hydrolase [Elusimicrobiota bacterium]